MSNTLALAAAAAWLVGFVLLRRFGTVLPLFAMAVGLAAWLLARDPTTRRLLRPDTRALAFGLAAGAAMIAATYLVYPLLAASLAPEVHGLYALLFAGKGRGEVAALVIAMSACEELLFRGRLLEGGEKPRCVVLAAFLYAGAHLTSGSVLLVSLAFSCGLLWGALRARTGSLWTPIVCHVLWDLAVMVVRPL